MSGPLTNPTGAFGVTDLQSTVWSNAIPFKTSAAVTAKRVVAIATDSNLVALAATNGTAALCVGIAEGAIASGYVGNVIIEGIAENVPCTGTVAAGDPLIRSAATTGSVATSATPAAGTQIGVAINASSGGVVDVWVCKA